MSTTIKRVRNLVPVEIKLSHLTKGDKFTFISRHMNKDRHSGAGQVHDIYTVLTRTQEDVILDITRAVSLLGKERHFSNCVVINPVDVAIEWKYILN